MKRTIAVSLVALAAALTGHHIDAYSVSGHHWASRQVPFYVNPVNNDVSQAAAIAALQDAAEAWRLQSTADITVYYAGTTNGTSLTNNGKNEIFFRNTSNGSTIAATYYWYGSDGRLLDADMVFYDGGFKFFTGQSGCSSGVYIEDVGVHEFGHFIGINHSTFSDASMYPTLTGSCNQSWRTLSGDDIAAVEAAYPGSTLPDPPAAPAWLSAQPDTTNSAYVDLTWGDQSNNEDGFQVQRSADGVSFATVGQVGANVNWFEDRGVTGGSAYWYRVRAANQGGSSDWSNVAGVQVPAPPPAVAPVGPTLLSPANGSTTTPKSLAWSKVTGAATYDVYFGKTSSPALYRSNLTGTSVSLGKLSAGAIYYWRVVAKNEAGAASSSTWHFTTSSASSKKGGGKGRNNGRQK